MELSSRRVHIAGITPSPNEAFMTQVARNLTADEDGFLHGKRFLIIDRDGKYCNAFIDMIREAGIRPVRCPAKAPNCNAYAERFVRSIKYECLNCMIFFGVGSLERAIRNYIEHYHSERNHQGTGSEIIERDRQVTGDRSKVECRERLGGLLRYYYHEAA